MPILKAVLTLCLAALVLGACSGDAGGPDRFAVRGDGAFSAGRYSTGKRFEPSFSFEPREQNGDVLFEAKPVPDDLVAWLQRHPHVGTENPEPVSIGGISGKRLGADVDVPEGYRDVREGGCAVPCIPLLRLGSGSVSHITEKGKDSLIVLKDVEGETVVAITAPADKFDEFLPDAQKVLRNVEWNGA